MSRNQTRKGIKILLISLFCFFLVGYTFYEIQKVIFGPKITVLSPTNGSSVSESLININGQAKNIKEISLNDRKIYMDENGNFNERILLSYGYNTLALKASDKFGRTTEKMIEVVYK